MRSDKILLEAGTNEVEILEFILGTQGYGVNVAKVQAILQYDPQVVTPMPMTSPSFAGVFLFRDRAVPLIDLGVELGIRCRGLDEPVDDAEKETKKIVLVMEFNQQTNAFLVNGVTRIFRLSWSDITPLSTGLLREVTAFTGSVHVDGREILLVDMERIVADILQIELSPPPPVSEENFGKAFERADVKIILAEDSTVVRDMLTESLQANDYNQITLYSNGAAAYEEVARLHQQAESEGRDITDFVDIVVTDIEMPQMDGLTLCKNVKTTLRLGCLPVVVFSSLINEQMARKCEAVGADSWISKPEFPKLVGIIDDLCLAKKPSGEAVAEKAA